MEATRAFTTGVYHIQPLAPKVCRVTLVQKADFGGLLPVVVMSTRIMTSLKTLKRLQDEFIRKGPLVDAEVQAEFPLPPRLDQLSSQQQLVVDRCVALKQTADWTPLTSTSPFVKMWSRLPERERGQRQLAIGLASTVIDCSPRQACAWWFDLASRERAKLSVEQGNPARLVWTANGPHDTVCATIKRMPFPLTSREFVVRQICAIDGGVFSWFCSSANDKVDYGSKKHARYVKAEPKTQALIPNTALRTALNTALHTAV